MKKIISVILSLILVTAICGCADTKSSTSSGTGKKNIEKGDVTSSVTESTGSDADDNTYNNSENSHGGDISNIADEEADEGQNISMPGTENWSSDPYAYILTVGNESIGNFGYYGWYVTENILSVYKKMTAVQKKQYLEYMFEGEGCNYAALIVDQRFYYQSEETGFDIEHFKEQMSVGEGGLLDEFAKRKIPIFANIDSVPNWMRDKNSWLQEKYTDAFARAIANMVYDLRVECGLNVVNVGIGDEPDRTSGDTNSKNISHYPSVLPKVKKYLKARGMENVGIVGAETCTINQKWLNALRSNGSSWNNLFAFSGHDFGFGGVTAELFNSTRITNKPLFVTSMGILDEHTVAGNFLGVTKSGVETVADYYTAMRNISPLLNNINMGANAITMWAPLTEVASITRLDAIPPNFYHIFYNSSGEVFKNNFATSATYYYYSQALNTVKPGAKIYQCSTDKEGTMGGSFEEYTMNAAAAVNKDGTWGINIFNKTDSEIAAPYAAMPYAPLPQAARTVTVNLDIKGLYGTGAKRFTMYSSNTAGSFCEEIGTVTLVDGRGTVEVFPLELLSLRSVDSIGLNNKPKAIKQEIKNLNVAYIGSNYMISSGKKTPLGNAPQMVYYNDYKDCGIKFSIKDFAALIGAEYTVSGKTVTVFNESGAFIFTLGDRSARYSGNIDGAMLLPEKVSMVNGEYFFELTDTSAGSISEIFKINYMQYKSTGLAVVGKTDVVNLGRFSALFN